MPGEMQVSGQCMEEVRLMEKRTTVILPDKSSLWEEIRELWEYRELIRMFVRKNFKTMYAQTVLGPAWFIVNALLSTSVLTLVFGRIANISTAGTPKFLFYMSGNMIWSFFAGCVSNVSGTFTSNARLMGKVYFPRLCVPIASVLSKQIQFLIQFLLFLVLYLAVRAGNLQITPGPGILLTPFLILEASVLAMGCGIIIASCTTKYRDLMVLVSFGLQLWMYGTPIVYPMSVIPPKLVTVMMLNPMAPVVETFRCVWFHSGSIPFGYLFVSMITTMAILLTGIVLFQRAQRSFMDTI